MFHVAEFPLWRKAPDFRLSRRFEAPKQGTGGSKVIESFYHSLFNSFNAVESGLMVEH
jgi:hypothetical protein